MGFIAGMIGFLSGCIPQKYIPHHFTKVKHSISLSQPLQTLTPTRSIQRKPHDIVTVWIHGTKITSAIIPVKQVKEFFDCEPGLNKANSLHDRYQIRKIAQTLIKHDSQEFPEDDFYLFGWSGKLSYAAREKAARHLHRSLSRLVDIYQRRYNITPKIRIITHSHGGNVALNLAGIQQNNSNLSIEELILLACPVQDETEYFIENELFKNIYSLYSATDMVQVIDPQGIRKGRKARTLFSRRCFTPLAKLKQAEITLERIAKLKLVLPLAHIEFMLTDFIKTLPHIIQEIDAWHNNMSDFVHNPHEHILQLTVKK